MTVPVTKNRYSMGFSLIEIAVVLLIISLLAAMALPMTAAYLNQQRRQATLARQAAIEAAINLFVSQNQRLPCPADGQLQSSNTSYGKENGAAGVCDGAANQVRGVVPFAALGLSAADGTDGWGNFFTYRVDTVLTAVGAMNFTFCTPAGTQPATGIAPNLSCNNACSSANFSTNCTAPTSVTVGRGLRVVDANGNLLADPSAAISTGAAYVLISHGENQLGSFQPEGGYINSGNPGSGDMEKNNYAGLAYGPTTKLVDAALSYGDGSGHFDDFVLRPSILTVAMKAQLGPRAY